MLPRPPDRRAPKPETALVIGAFSNASSPPLQIFEYNGSAIVAMAGKNCVAIGSDTRFGVQFQTLATDYKKVRGG
jgi:20S proteasome alpha/beta subunit